jgi:DNA-binding response OmpR family regulator
MRIAVLDDDPLQLELIDQVVRQAGHLCRLHHSGASFVQDLRRESFDLLLVDWEVPDLSGPVVRWAREHLPPPCPSSSSPTAAKSRHCRRPGLRRR